MEHGRGLVIIRITQKCWLVFKFAMQPSSVCRTSRKSHRCTSSRTHLYWFRKLRGIAILYHSGSFTAVQQQSWLWFVRLPCLAKNIQPYTRPLQLRVRIKRQLCSSGKPPKVCAKQPNSRGATSRRWLSSQNFQVCTRFFISNISFSADGFLDHFTCFAIYSHFDPLFSVFKESAVAIIYSTNSALDWYGGCLVRVHVIRIMKNQVMLFAGSASSSSWWVLTSLLLSSWYIQFKCTP